MQDCKDIKGKEYVLHYFLNWSKNRKLAETLTRLATYKHISAGESILEAGQRTNYICLVVSGLVRGFYIDEEGNDRTKCFSVQGDWCCSYNYLSDMPCPFYLEAEQDTVLAMFNIQDVDNIKEKFPILKTKIEELLAETMMKSEQRIYSFISMEAKDRYMLIMKEQPELIKTVKQEHIASYLGVTPSSLSRLKKICQHLPYDNYKALCRL